jgi:SanA protein
MNKALVKRVFVGGFLIGILFSISIVFMSEHVRRRGEKIMRLEFSFEHPATAIVLGAAVWPGNIPSHMLEDRVLAAVKLYHEGRVSEILMSGNRDGEYNEPDVMAALAVARGIKPEAIRCDYEGYTTRHTMRNAQQLFGISNAIIITQEYHLPRALFLGERAGMRVLGATADLRVYKNIRRDRVREFFARVKSWLQEL